MFTTILCAPDAGATAGGNSGAGEQTQTSGNETKAEVVYGVQPEAGESGQPEAGAESTGEAKARDKKAEWQKLIQGEYKDEFQNQTQGIINKRFKEMKTLQEQNGALSALAEKLGDRYGVDPKDIQALTRAIQEDKAFLREQADKAGLTVDQYRSQREMQRENAYWRARQQEAERQEGIRRQLQQWDQESEELRKIYPDFNLEQELAGDHGFADLVKSGIPLRKAYEVAHFDQIVGGALQYAVNETRAQTAQNIMARGNRPQEGAVTGGAAVNVKSDVTKLTKADREAIAQQVLKGKTISFS